MDLARALEMADAVRSSGSGSLPPGGVRGAGFVPLQQASASLLCFCVNMEMWEVAELVRGCMASLSLELHASGSGADELAALEQLQAVPMQLDTVSEDMEEMDEMEEEGGEEEQEQQDLHLMVLIRDEAQQQAAAAGVLLRPTAPQPHPLLLPLLAFTALSLQLQLAVAVQRAALVTLLLGARAAERAAVQQPDADASASTPPAAAGLRRRTAAAGGKAAPALARAPEAASSQSGAAPAASKGARRWFGASAKTQCVPDLASALHSEEAQLDLRRSPLGARLALLGFTSPVLEQHYQQWKLAYSMPCDMATLAIALSQSSLVLHNSAVRHAAQGLATWAMALLELLLVAVCLLLLAARRHTRGYSLLRQHVLVLAITSATFVLLMFPPADSAPWSSSLSSLWKVMFVQRYLLLPYCFHVGGSRARWARGCCRLVPALRCHCAAHALPLRCAQPRAGGPGASASADLPLTPPHPPQSCSMQVGLLQLGLAAASQVLPDSLFFGGATCAGSWLLSGAAALAINAAGATVATALDLCSRRQFVRLHN
jgi:hypothetical protein